MRKFSSYGPINPRLHYHVPRKTLIDFAVTQLLGDIPDEGGRYITVWAPRQRGKTWIMQWVMERISHNPDFEVAILSMQSAKSVNTIEGVLKILVRNLRDWFKRDFPDLDAVADLAGLFTTDYFSKPLILILDEFDALDENFINQFANEFRDMYVRRSNELKRKSGEKSNLLHGLALIGVRSVLGIENVTGSPFNHKCKLKRTLEFIPATRMNSGVLKFTPIPLQRTAQLAHTQPDNCRSRRDVCLVPA